MGNAQGKGWPTGASGGCCGGERTSGYLEEKQQLFRSLDDINLDSRLADLEAEIMRTANTLGVGPMGFGGKTTLLACKIGKLNRLPASFFASIAYMCLAFRRPALELSTGGTARNWLH